MGDLYVLKEGESFALSLTPGPLDHALDIVNEMLNGGLILTGENGRRIQLEVVSANGERRVLETARFLP